MIEEVLRTSRVGLVRRSAPLGLATLKSRIRRVWMAGDYDRLAHYTRSGAEDFYRRLAVPFGCRLLDVGCGSGQLALIAARNGVEATGVDIAENLVERARERAHVEGLAARFRLADAEALPFADSSFDVVTSLAGAMFAPRPQIVARELLRVCRAGGMIAMGNWTEQGFVGQMFRIISKAAAPSEVPAAFLWGDEATVRERLQGGISSLQLTLRTTELSFPFPPGEVVRFFRACHGPTNRAFASLGRPGRKRLQEELESLWSACNLARGGFTKVDAERLEVIAVRS